MMQHVAKSKLDRHVIRGSISGGLGMRPRSGKTRFHQPSRVTQEPLAEMGASHFLMRAASSRKADGLRGKDRLICKSSETFGVVAFRSWTRGLARPDSPWPGRAVKMAALAQGLEPVHRDGVSSR